VASGPPTSDATAPTWVRPASAPTFAAVERAGAPPSRRRALAAAAGIAAVVVAGAALGWTVFARGPTVDAGAYPSLAAAPDAAPAGAAATSATVEVRLVGVPAGSTVLLDGAVVRDFPITLARGSAMRTLVVRHPEHGELRVMVNPTADQTIAVELERPAAALEPVAPREAPPRKVGRPPQPRGPRTSAKTVKTTPYEGPDYLD
jgi:hypothetical protein